MSDFKRLLFIVNPHAGVMKKEGILTDILSVFQEYEYETIIMLTRKHGDATDYVIEHAGDDIDIIVCMGGDGTLNEVFAGAVKIGWGKPIGYIPAGSTNDFAASLGIPGDHIAAAKRIMEGEGKDLDLGEFNGRTFVYTASNGLFSKTSYETPQKVKNRLGHLAYILEGVKDITQFKPVYMEIETENDVIQDEFILVSICNTFSLGGIMSFEDSNIELDDGVFELLTITRPRDLLQLNSIIVALYEQNYDNQFVNFIKARKLRINVPEALDWSLDGEKQEGAAVCEFRVLPSAVKLIY